MMRRRTAPTVLNVIRGIGRLISMMGWWQLGGGLCSVGLSGLGPTRKSAGAEGEVNHNPNSKLKKASAENRGNTGSESNCGRGVNFRNNRVPVREHLPGFNFGGVGHIRCGTVGLSALRNVTRTRRLSGVNVGRLVRTNFVSSSRLIGVLTGNGLATGLRIRTRTFSGDTRTTVRTMNKAIIGLWIVETIRAVGGV